MQGELVWGYPLTLARFPDEPLSQGPGLCVSDRPTDDITAKHVQDDVQVEVGPRDGAHALRSRHLRRWRLLGSQRQGGGGCQQALPLRLKDNRKFLKKEAMRSWVSPRTSRRKPSMFSVRTTTRLSGNTAVVRHIALGLHNK